MPETHARRDVIAGAIRAAMALEVIHTLQQALVYGSLGAQINNAGYAAHQVVCNDQNEPSRLYPGAEIAGLRQLDFRHWVVI